MLPMMKVQPAPPLSGNRLFARLPPEEYQRLRPLLRLVPLKFKQVLNELGSPVDYLYFPVRGVVSAVTLMADGTVIEVATVGNEGMVGLTAFFGDEESPNRQVVQVPGESLRMSAADFRAETTWGSPLHKLLVRYNTAFFKQISQAVACNGLHNVQQRCCRWVLMTHDRAQADEFLLTHEFLSHMLGVRRMSITDVLKPLQDAGLIRNQRGHITVLDRPGLEATVCECYRSVQDTFDRLLGPVLPPARPAPAA
jgi:CRP-like cAMP-binding protein